MLDVFEVLEVPEVMCCMLFCMLKAEALSSESSPLFRWLDPAISIGRVRWFVRPVPPYDGLLSGIMICKDTTRSMCIHQKGIVQFVFQRQGELGQSCFFELK